MKPCFLVVNKPVGLTSHDVVAIVRAVTGIKKVGHTGTLDPFATGVLPLAIGPATRLIQYLDEDLKVYDATIQLGQETDTGDPTGEVVEEVPVPPLDLSLIEEATKGFLGDQMQTPPRYSAVKIKGKRLYRYAREGKEVDIPARPIRIDDISVISFEGTQLRVRIECGRGTYARVLANDIAKALGTVGHLSALERLQSGPFGLAQSIEMVDLAKIVADRTDWLAVLRPARGAERVQWAPREQVRAGLQKWVRMPGQVLGHLATLQLDSTQASLLRSGGPPPPVSQKVQVGDLMLMLHEDSLVALARRQVDGVKVVRRFGK